MRLTSLAAAFALLALEASACSCMRRSEAETIAAADAVFAGDVLSVSRETGQSHRGVRAEISVTEITKGKIARRVTVFTASHSAMCGVNFAQGRRVRIAVKRRADGLTTSICMNVGLRG